MKLFKDIQTLQKYFVWVDSMRHLFDQKRKAARGKDDFIDMNIYMSYWYCGLYAVIEGWKDLGLSDEAVDRLLHSPNVALLRRYQNGTFHFLKNHFDERFLGFLRDGEDPVAWIRELSDELKQYFLLRAGRGDATEA